MAKYRCAILDDYQNVTLKVADWSKVSGDLDIKVFNEHLGGADNVVKALADFELACARRERPASPRAWSERRPKLKRLTPPGRRNAPSGGAAAPERSVPVGAPGSSGTPPPAMPIGLRLDLPRHIGYEN